jgi:hypothetical protein
MGYMLQQMNVLMSFIAYLYDVTSVQYSIKQQAEPLENIIDRRDIEITNLILPDEDIHLT